ncbi:LacI family DNA-binding transcriptional regulator [Cellulosimicrobium terreum]|nr:LacI family DNA-binding transcriptional regulator [Cellulosimicrobium terreum]
MTRIVDVARSAGVSTATVSRVLNGKSVRPELVAAVRAAVDELGYVPDRTARSLRRRTSDVVALVLPDVENPFFTAVARGVEDVAQEAGYSVVLCNTDDDPAKEARYLTVVEHENMAGVVIAPANDSPPLAALRARRRGVVVIDRRTTHDDVDHVLFDDAALGRHAAGTLVGRGFRRIACITGPRTTSTAVERARGWRSALVDGGVEVDDRLLVHANFRVDGGYDAMRDLLARADPPDAVLATNNLVGVGVLRALADAHGRPAAAPVDAGRDAGRGARRGPELGVGVVGDLPFATSRTSDVVLVPLDPRALGTTAARLLLDRLGGDATPARAVVQEAPPG